MALTKEEAIYFLLKNSKDNKITSPTKLNKMLARLNLLLIPIDIEFSLNKYGSYNSDIADLEEGNYWNIEQYEYMGKTINSYKLTNENKEIDSKVNKKLSKLFSQEELKAITEEINSMSQKRASELSQTEHKKLLVDVENRTQLIHRANDNTVNFFDLHDEIKNKEPKTLNEIKLYGLVEHCFELAKFLKNKINKVPENEYTQDEYMNTYYYLKILEDYEPFLKQQLQTITDERTINKLFEFIVRKDDGYSFSIHNKNYNSLKVVN